MTLPVYVVVLGVIATTHYFIRINVDNIIAGATCLGGLFTINGNRLPVASVLQYPFTVCVISIIELLPVIRKRLYPVLFIPVDFAVLSAYVILPACLVAVCIVSVYASVPIWIGACG